MDEWMAESVRLRHRDGGRLNVDPDRRDGLMSWKAHCAILLGVLPAARAVADATPNIIFPDKLERVLSEGKVASCFVVRSSDPRDSRAFVSGVYDAGRGRHRFQSNIVYTDSMASLINQNVNRSSVTGSTGNAAVLKLLLVLPFILFLVSLAAFVFWLWMLTDCLRKAHPDQNDKLLWTLVILFANIMGAVLYFVIQRHKVRVTSAAEG